MKIFISHPFADEDLALQLKKILEEHPKIEEAYMAQRVKEYELLIRDKIKNQIINSDYVVAIVTRNTRESASVNQELGYAQGQSVPIITMVEEDAKVGVLLYGQDLEKFSRPKFEKSCNDVVNYIIQHGPRNKVTKEELKELIQNVYEPCYNFMKNVYDSSDFITNIPPDPWRENISNRWKLKTEPEIKGLFEKYTKERETWSYICVEFGNAMQSQHHKLGDIVSKAFKGSGLIQDGTSYIRLDERSTMDARDWIKAFDHIILDIHTNNPETLYQNLLNYSIQTKNGHRHWLEKWWNDNNGFYSNLLEVIPELKRNFICSVTTQQLDEQREPLKKSIKELTIALEEKLK